jgi:phosphoribosylaminoimidazole-succinocarboxamide synthase
MTSDSSESLRRQELRPAVEQALGLRLERTDLHGLGQRVEGKVRDSYLTSDGRRYLVVCDRISAFDRVLGTVPLKGQVLNQLAGFWFQATKDVVPNHFLSQPDPCVTEAQECTPFAVEFVVRGYITGVTSTSMWTHYAAGKREFCGLPMADGWKKNQRLPEIMLTPTTKAEKGGHDESVSRAELLARGVISESDFEQASAICKKLFKFGQEHCAKRGLILVDSKYELGKRADGEIVVIDEIHTPDSSRYWMQASYDERFAKAEEPESLDKEYVRRWLAAAGYTGEGPLPVIPDDVWVEAALRYITAFEQITGTQFEPNLEAPGERIHRNLKLAL